MLTSKGWIDPWKTFIRTRELNANQAVLDVNVGIGSALDGGLKFEVEICDATGKMVASGSSDDLNNEGIAQMASPNCGVPNHLIYIPPVSNTRRAANCSTS